MNVIIDNKDASISAEIFMSLDKPIKWFEAQIESDQNK